MATSTRSCPGCGLTLPLSDLAYDRKFNASPECWSVFETVIAAEFQNAVLHLVFDKGIAPCEVTHWSTVASEQSSVTVPGCRTV